MKRRELLIASIVLTVSPFVHGQQAGRQYRIGWIGTTKSTFNEPYGRAVTQRLAELGYVEGRNLVIERRHPDGRLDALPAVSAELGKLRLDSYFGGGGDAILAAAVRSSAAAPIVFVAVDFDPIATGDVASLARPGGRVTGITAQQSELPAKRLELLAETLPGVRRVAVLANEQTTGQVALVQGTARRMGLDLHVVDLKRPPFDFPAAFADAARAKAQAIMALSSSLFVPARRQIPELALKAKLPTMFPQAQWVEAGGLVSYGFDFVKMWRRAAEILAKVLAGEKPAGIPMEQPRELELAINLKTAKSLGLTIPPSILQRATRVNE